MTVRWQAGDQNGVPSGYDSHDVPASAAVPPCGIEDVDFGVFKLFEKEIGFQVTSTKGDVKTVIPVPVRMGVGEKWAANKKNRPSRDKQGTLILPLISIRQTGIEQSVENDQKGRGVNQATGEVTFRRRLSPEDRDFQNLVNKLGITNQRNLPYSSSQANQVGSRRQVGRAKWNAPARAGAWLSPELNSQNVWEFIVIPSPQFYTVNYEVTFWTQYRTQMNQMIQRLMAAKLPQLPAFKVKTQPGYWFVAYTNDDYKSEDNFDDIVDNERIIKYTFTIKVPAYTVAPDESGMKASARRYISCPEVSFETFGDGTLEQVDQIRSREVPLLDNADDPTIGVDPHGNPRTKGTNERGKFVSRLTRSPFARDDKQQLVRVVSSSPKSGEQVLMPIGPDVEFDLD